LANLDKKTPGVAVMGLRYDEISDILKLIDGSSCDEFILETEDIKLVVRRHGANGAAAPAELTRSAPRAAAAPALAASPPQGAPATAKVAETAHGSAHIVTAPMVGTFFRSPSPGAPPFVEVGSKVKVGDPICIIEVMKLFTTINSEWSGTVIEIGAQNGHLVEYGQMLFVISPD
jgi:acetyl-CoA carboxylase biotin carboxyl carrier protein